MSAKTMNLSSELTEYLQQHSVKMPEGLQALRQATYDTFEAAPMLISPEQGQFFHVLLKTINAKRVLEVGTFTGYSAAVMAMALPEDGHVTCCDLSYDWTRLAVEYWPKLGLDDKITLHLAPALETLDGFIAEKTELFDFAFIDADKLNYLNYYERCLQLVRPGGIIAIDNVLWGGKVADKNEQAENTNIIRQLNERVFNDDRVTMCMLPIGDGLTLATVK